MLKRVLQNNSRVVSTVCFFFLCTWWVHCIENM